MQLPLPEPKTWGGRRDGAGRKARAGRRDGKHRTRAAHAPPHPVHVVLRSKMRSLRSPFIFPTVRQALIKAASARLDFRILHFSVQADHVHLIVEADSHIGLARGIQGLAIRTARALNRLLLRHGSLWSSRYFSRALTTPREVKNAIAYVLNNFRKHGECVHGNLDPCSSSVCDISAPQTWLARSATRIKPAQSSNPSQCSLV